LPSLLTKLHLEELSLVDRPANAQAMVSLFKRDNSNEDITKMTEEMEAKVKANMKEKGYGRDEAMKALGYDMDKAQDGSPEVAEDTAKAEEVNPLEAEVEALKAEIEELNKSASLEKSDDKIEVSGEMISKSDIPAPVLKALEVAAFEKADIALTKRAEEALPHFDLAVAKSLVEKFSESEEIMVALKAADSAFEASMQEFGKSDVDGEFASSKDKLDAIVKSYMDDNQLKKSDYAKAYAVVAKTDEGKSLINKTYKGE